MISSILPRPLEVFSRSTLEALVKNSTNDDLSSYSDDELKDLILELYPLDALSSLAFARRGVEGETYKGEDVVSRDFARTSIDMVLGDHNWSYVFWSIDSFTLNDIVKEDKNYSLFIRVHETYEKDGKQTDDFFDVEVQKEERERNIYLQGLQNSSYVELYVKKNGSDVSIAKSHKYDFHIPYVLKHEDEHLPSLFFEPFLNKDGNLVISNVIIENLYTEHKREEE